MKNKVGRPIEKINRIKIGLSLEGKYNDMLKELSITSGKTKSRLVEEAISLISEIEHSKIDRERKIEEKRENPFDDLRAMFNAKYSQKDKIN